MTLPARRLGTHGPEVSAVALGSWRTFERLPRDRAVDVMRHARERGITLLDDARYNDETAVAPLATGYSEVLFGELFRAAGYERSQVAVSEKLWWEFWPEQSAAAELEESLARLGFDHVDLIYAMAPPQGLAVERVVEEVAGLLASGRARAWGITNWRAPELRAANAAAVAAGIDPPCAAQLPYSLVARAWAEDPEMVDAMREGGTGLVASAVLAGGLLTGKYSDAGGSGRMAAALDDPGHAAGLAAGAALRELAADLDAAPAALAVAFVLGHPLLSSVLVGATSPAQLDESIAGLELRERLGTDELAGLCAIGAPG